MSDRKRDGIAVWDLPTRLFHWALVLLVCFSLISGAFRDSVGGPNILNWHALSGYTILTLLIFRLLWGFVGGTHARFASFIRGPGAVIAYLTDLRHGDRKYTGHNPAGGWSAALMLVSLAVQAGIGLFLSDGDFAFNGPLSRHVSERTGDLLQVVHEVNAIVLTVLIALHLLAIAFYWLVKRDNLVRSMITGRKHIDAPPQTGGHPLLGAAVLALAAGVVWLIVNKL